MATQVDGAGLDVDVHQVVDDFTLNVILDPVDEKTAAHVYHFDEGVVSAGGRPTGRCETATREDAFVWRSWGQFCRTCHTDQGPEAGSWSCNIRSVFGNPSWLQSCYSPYNPDRKPSLPKIDVSIWFRFLLCDHGCGPPSLSKHVLVFDSPWCLRRSRWDLHTPTRWRRSGQKKNTSILWTALELKQRGTSYLGNIPWSHSPRQTSGSDPADLWSCSLRQTPERNRETV